VADAVDGALSVAAGGDEGSGVLHEQSHPVADVGGVVHPAGLLEAELCAPERCAELGDEFLGAVGLAAEPARQVAGKPGRGGRINAHAHVRTSNRSRSAR
jgi:hypothetical protein